MAVGSVRKGGDWNRIPRMTTRHKLVYLLAASHSGSTLTAMLLGAHPELSCVGELKANHLGDPGTYLCSCRRNILECDFWKSITQRMQGFGIDFSITNAGTNIRSGAGPWEERLLDPLVRSRPMELLRDMALSLSPNWHRNLQEIQKRNTFLVRSVLEETGAGMIVDSSKIGIRLKYLLRNRNLDIKVIWLTRDGRGVSLAYLNPSEFADAKDAKMRGGGRGATIEPSRDIATGSHEWVRCNEEAMQVLSTLDRSRWIRIRYEDVCNHTEETLDRIFDFLEVDKHRKVLDFRSVEHHMVGNGMRLDRSSEILLDERWKQELDRQQLEIFEKVAGTMRRRLGYPDPP